MAEINPVFELVHSLSQPEKRFFTRFAHLQTGRKENAYLALFHAMASADGYNPEKLQRKFGQKFFPQLLQQLYRKLLQAMRVYHENSDTAGSIESCRMNYSILLSAGLEKEAGRELQKAIRLAESSGQAHVYAWTGLYESASLMRTAETEEMENYLRSRKSKVKNQAQVSAIESSYEFLLLESEILNRQFEATRQPAELRRIADFLQHPLLQNEKQAQSPRAHLLYYFIKGLVSYLNCDYAVCAALMEKAVKHFRKFPLTEDPGSRLRIRAYANRSLGYFHAGRLQKAAESVEALDALELISPSEKQYREELSQVLRLMMLNREGKYAEALQWAGSLIAAPDVSRPVSQQETYIAFQRAAACWGVGDPKRAAAILGRFIDQRKRGMKKDAYFMARIFFMLLRFELNDETLLQSELRSVHRLLKNENKLFLFEKQMLRFIGDMQVANTTPAIRKNFQQLKKELDEIALTEYERNAFLYFDFRLWVARKLK